MNKTEKVMIEPMGDDDVKKYLPDAKIIKYNKLQYAKTIDDVLPNNLDCVFVLYESSQNNGHWVMLSKYNNTIEYFDSYGNKVDVPLKWISPEKNKELGQAPYLTNLLNNTDKKVVYNNEDYQSDHKAVATCGRWCVCRYLTILKKYDLKKFKKLIDNTRKKTGLKNDEIVSKMVSAV